MKRLTTEQILMLHSQLIMTTGGLDGVRDKGLVDSSLSSAFEVYFAVERYPTIEEKAARLCYSLIKNHAFLDGNKRIAVFAMLVFLELNGIILDCEDAEIVDLGLGAAASELDYEDILEFIQSH